MEASLKNIITRYEFVIFIRLQTIDKRIWFQISIVQLREEQGDFLHIGTFEHPYPATKVLWIPDPVSLRL